MEASFPNGWSYRCKLTYSMWSTGYSDLTNFPVCLYWTGTSGLSTLPSGMMDADGGGAALSNGADIRFSQDKYGKIPLAFEIVQFSTNNNTTLASGEIHVKLPTLYYNMNTPFYIWWGNSSASALAPNDTYGSQNVWDSNFVFVEHMEESAAPWKDSTSNVHISTSNSNVAQGSGYLSKGAVYSSESATAYIGYSGVSSLSPTTALTLSAWVKATNWNSNRRIIQKGVDSQYKLSRETGAGGTCLYLTLTGPTGTSASGALPSSGVFHHFAATYNSAATQAKFYIDGGLVNTTAMSGNIASTLQDLNIGHKPSSGSNGDSMLGTIDEVRISNIARSDDWINSEWANQDRGGVDLYVGVTETLGVLAGWKRKCAITNDRTKLAGDVVDIQCPFVWTGNQATSNLPQEMMDADGGFAALPTGADIRFTTDPNGCEQLAYEIEEFSTNNNPTLARAQIWVRVKNLSSASNTTIYLWYLNPNATAIGIWDTQGKQSVWRDNINNFVSVYHMGGSGDVTDSTAQGVSYFVNFGTTAVSGIIGSGRAFNGSSQYLETYQNTFVEQAVPRTIMYWVNRATRNLEVGWGSNTAGGEFVTWTSVGGGNYGIWGWGPGADYNTGVGSSLNTWEHIVAEYTGTVERFYVNGVQKGTDNTVGLVTTNAHLMAGKFTDAGPTTYWFQGSMDEIMVTRNAISATYITAFYNSQASPQTFWSLGAPDSWVFPVGWKFKCKLTQDHTKNAADQANFPSLLAWTGSTATSNLPSGMFASGSFYAAKSDGSDVRVTTDAAGTNQLPLEVVSFTQTANPTNARGEIYVKVPNVYSASDANIYVWWGNANATALRTYDIIGRDSVWSDYLMVYHFESTTLTDSTGNGYDATNSGLYTSSGFLVGNAANFNGSTAFATVPNIAASVNMSGWAKWYITSYMNYGATQQWSRMFEFAKGDGGQESLLFANNGTSTASQIRYTTGAYTATNDQAGNITLNQWDLHGYLLSAGIMTTIKNGAAVGSPTTVSGLPSNVLRSGYLGKSLWSGSDANYSGKMDEFRFRKTYSSSFRTSDYNTLSNPGTYWGMSTPTLTRGSIAITGVWKDIARIWIAKDGVWKDPTKFYVSITGVWKDAC